MRLRRPYNTYIMISKHQRRHRRRGRCVVFSRLFVFYVSLWILFLFGTIYKQLFNIFAYADSGSDGMIHVISFLRSSERSSKCHLTVVLLHSRNYNRLVLSRSKSPNRCIRLCFVWVPIEHIQCVLASIAMLHAPCWILFLIARMHNNNRVN